MKYDFSGKVFFVTGGGRGIGKSICEYLGSCGAHVGLTYTGSPESEKRAQEVWQQCLELNPNHADAWEHLGNYYDGIRDDPTRAVQCHEKAAALRVGALV